MEVMDEDDSDSDCTVLLTDFVDKPQKVDAKRRRLSQLQDRRKQADRNDDNIAQNDASQNIQTGLPNNTIEKNWLITKYFSGINKTNILNNTSDIRGNDNLHKHASKYVPNSDIICLDSDDEAKSNEKSQNQDTNKGQTEISSANDSLHETKLIVLKPAAINARRATIDIFESNEMFSNENVSQRLKEIAPSRLGVLKPSIINARRTTTHFEENNLECNVKSIGKDDMSKNYKMESGNKKRTDKDSYEFTSPRLSPFESNIPNTTSRTSSDKNAGICVATGAKNSLTSIFTVSNKKLNTDISDNTIIDNKYFQQDKENKTVANVKANKRSSINESQIEPKRIKMNLKPKSSVKQHEDTEQMTNEQCKVNVMCEEKSNEEYSSHDKAINDTIRRAKCDRQNETISSLENNACKAEKKLEEHILPGKQEISKVQYEQVINEAPTNLKISQVPREHEPCNCDEQDRSIMQDNRNANEKAGNRETSEYVLDKTIATEISKKQKTSQVVDETAPTEANTKPETFVDQDSANEVLNTEDAVKILDKTILRNTTNENKVQNIQIKSKVSDKQETNKLYEEQRTIETVNREDKEEKTRKVSSEQTVTESHSEQGTDQLNETSREASLNVGAVNNKRGLKFQIFFLTYILENLIKDEYPEFGITLQNIIKTLLDNARHGSFQTHVQYACPECGCLSNYSSNLSNTESGVSKLKTERSQNCDLCRGVREIHTSYLEKYSKKIDQISNKKDDVESTPAKNNHAKQQVAQCDKSVTHQTSSNSKTILEENNNNDSVSMSVVEDRCVSLPVDKEKQTDNISSTRSALETQTGNHNDSKEHKINSETPFIEASETQGGIKITSNMNKIVSIKDKLTVSNKITKEIDKQSVINKRMKTVTESNEENLRTKDDSSYLTSDNADKSVIEYNNKMDHTTQKVDSAVELPKNILLGIQKVAPSIGSSQENNKASCSKRDNSSNFVYPVVLVSNSDADFNRDLRSALNDSNTAKIASKESPAEGTHMNTINLNTQEMSLKPKSHGDNIITAETDELMTKSDNNSNDVANEKPIDPTTQKVLSDEVEKNDKLIKNSCNKPAMIEAQIRNTDEVHKHNQSVIKSLVENSQLNKANEEEGSQPQGKDKTVLNLASKESFRTDKLINGATIAYKYICPHCTSTYKHPSKLLRHLKNKYNVRVTKIPEKCIRLQCPFCNCLLHQKSYNKHVARCRSDMHENTNVNKQENENHSKIRNVRVCSSGRNEQFETSESRFKYFCSICEETLTTDYSAARQHRTQFHPEFKHRHIIKKIRNGIKSNKEQEEKQNDDGKDTDNVDNLNMNCGNLDGASETITTAVISNQTTTNSRKKRKLSTNRDMSCKEDEGSCDSDESSSYSDHSYKTSKKSDKEDDDENKTKALNANGEGISTDNNAPSTSKRPIFTFICKLCHQRLYTDYATRKHRLYQHPDMLGRPLFKKIKYVELKENTSKLNNERKRLLEDNNSSSSTDRVNNVEQINSTRDGKIGKRYKADKSENASDSDWSPASDSDCFGKRSTRESHTKKRCRENTETASEDEIIKASDYLVRKRKKRITKLYGAKRQGSCAATIKENSEDDSDWIDSQNTDTDETNDTDDEIEEDYDSQKTDVRESNDDSNFNTDEEYLPVSDNKTLNTSMRTSKKRKQRLLKFVNDSTDTDETDDDQQVACEESDNDLLTDHDNQCDNNDIASITFGEERLSDDEIIKVSENTRKKRKERMSTLFDDDIEIDFRNGENDDENFINVRQDQAHSKKVYCKTSDKVCDMYPAIVSTNATVVRKQNDSSESSELSNLQLRDDDRREIDLIDCLLKEYNTHVDERNDSCAEKEKDGEDDRDTDIQNDQTGANIDNQPLPEPEVNNCLEKMQITNITSIANKLYIFICQECSYATDTYDDTIRHCQNHFNLIEDPVTYCNICQIKYDSSCFVRHEISHDKYLINIKIKFSYQWLFSSWQKVFENNHILLGEAEDMQVQSIYKTHCIKMTVREHGPWQTALYLCAKCNIFVPPLDIEKHVQEKCTLTQYACAICHRSFLTHEMREHHKIYHTDEVTQPFKTIVFNEKKYEGFNSKLILIKLQLSQNKEKHRNVKIYKCICGLCFITLKQFKLHFVDCESDTNDGVQCLSCSGSLRFLHSDLELHMSLHHSATKYEFSVKKIQFQEERDYDSSEPIESTTDNNVEDINTKNEMLNDKALSQGDINVDQEILSSLENAVQQMSIHTNSNFNREVTKDELLSQNTNDNIDIIEDFNTKGIADNLAQIMSTAEDRHFKRDFNKRDGQKTLDIFEEDLVNKSTVVNATQIGSNVEDLNVKQEMLKNEVFSQNTIENIQEYTKAFEEHLETIGSEQLMIIDEDLINKKEMLKVESFSQNTNEEISQKSQDVIKKEMLKVESFSQNTNEEISQDVIKKEMLKVKSFSQNTNEEINQKSQDVIKEEMLKVDSFSQNTNEEISQKSQDVIEENLVNKTATDDAAQINSNDEDIVTKRDMLKDVTLSENTIEEDTKEKTEISEETAQNRDSTNILLIVQGDNIKKDTLKNEITNKVIQNCLRMEEIFKNIENPTQKTSFNEDLNVSSHSLISQVNTEAKNLENQNSVVDLETENSKVVETEDTIVIEDSDDDDVEFIGEDLNDQRFVQLVRPRWDLFYLSSADQHKANTSR